MDVTALRDRIQSTLDPNADNRRQAELDLKYVRGGAMAGTFRVTWWGKMRAHAYSRGGWCVGRNAARIHQCTFGYLAGGADKRCAAVWYVFFDSFPSVLLRSFGKTKKDGMA